MPGDSDRLRKKIYPWWVAPLITTIVAILVVPFIFGFAYLYLHFWHQDFINLLNDNFNLFTPEQISTYTSFTFDKLIDLGITQFCTILYNLLAFLLSFIIGLKRKRNYNYYVLPTLQEQILDKSGELGREYKRLSEEKIKIKALMDLLDLSPDEAKNLMELRATTRIARLENIYTMSEDIIAFNCCKEQIFNSAVKKRCKTIKISGIAQFEFIGKYGPNFNRGDGSIDQYGLKESIFLHLLEIKNSIDFQILLMDPNGPRANEFIQKRIESLNCLGPRITIDSYKKDIKDTIDFIEYLKNNLKRYDRFKNKNITLSYKLFDDEPIFRYYITEDTLFLSQYIDGYHGHLAMVYEIGKSDESLYGSFSRLFDLRWNKFN